MQNSESLSLHDFINYYIDNVKRTMDYLYQFHIAER